MRFALAVVAEVRRFQATGSFIFGYLISPEEPDADGLRISNSLVLIDRLIRTVQTSTIGPIVWRLVQGAEEDLYSTVEQEERREPQMGQKDLQSYVCSAPVVVNRSARQLAVAEKLELVSFRHVVQWNGPDW